MGANEIDKIAKRYRALCELVPLLPITPAKGASRLILYLSWCLPGLRPSTGRKGCRLNYTRIRLETRVDAGSWSIRVRNLPQKLSILGF